REAVVARRLGGRAGTVRRRPRLTAEGPWTAAPVRPGSCSGTLSYGLAGAVTRPRRRTEDAIRGRLQKNPQRKRSDSPSPIRKLEQGERRDTRVETPRRSAVARG